MPFNMTLAWMGSGAFVVALLAMAWRNRESGWQRPAREDVYTDMLTFWAESVREERMASVNEERVVSRQPRKEWAAPLAPAQAFAATSDLAALRTAVGYSAPVRTVSAGVAAEAQAVVAVPAQHQQS
jgi:hypothetical protein